MVCTGAEVPVDVNAWLQKLGLEKYAAEFAANDVDYQTLPYLTDADLKELGVSLGHRRKLLAAIDAIYQADESGAAEPERESAGDARRPKSAELRQITVVFCDLVGSTELSRRLEPETLREVLHRYQDAMAGSMVRHGGHVAKYLGDGVLCFFGWPQAHEDQAARAIRGSLSARDALRKLDVALFGLSEPLKVRIGVATGHVVIGDITGDTVQEQDAISGETPNLAARLQGLARENAIVIEDVTRKLLGSRFELEANGRHELKGFSDPVEIWTVTREANTPSRFDAIRSSALTQFVGRDREIAVLHESWRRAADGEGEVVVLSGEAGLGKSRVLREFGRFLSDEGVKIVRLQCAPDLVNAAFHPFTGQIAFELRTVERRDESAYLAALKNHLADVFTDAREPMAMIAPLLSLPFDEPQTSAMSPQRRKLRTIAAFVHYILDSSREQPIAVFAEDLHWVDASSLETLDAAVDRVQDRRVLIVATHRPEFEQRWSAYDNVTHLSLTRLARRQALEIVKTVADEIELGEDVVDQIVDHSDGVPLFVEELTRAVIETRQKLGGSVNAITIPTSLRASLAARIDKFGENKGILQAAACIGRVFDSKLLGELIGLETPALGPALETFQQAQLIFKRNTFETTQYIFKHALVQDAAYDSLLMARRRELHGRLARLLSGVPDTDPLVLAGHLAKAGEAARSAATYAKAGEVLIKQYSLAEAIAALELGLTQCELLEASPQKDGLELGVRVALGTARMAHFGWAHPSVSQALEPSYALAKSGGDTSFLGPILWGLWVHYQTRTDFEQAHVWLARLESLANKDVDPQLAAVRDMSAGCQYFWQAEYERARHYTDSLRKTYSPSLHGGIVAYTNHDPLCFSLHWAGALLEWIAGRPETSLDLMAQSVERARQLSHPFNFAFALTAGASNLLYLARCDELLAYCAEVAERADEEGLGTFIEKVLVGQWRGAALLFNGAPESGLPLVEDGNSFWNAMEGRVCNAMFRSWIALGNAGVGRYADALNWIDATIQHCRHTGDRYMEPECLRLRAEFVFASGETSEPTIERDLREAAELADAQNALSWRLRASMSLAEHLRRDRRRDEAGELLRPALDAFQEGHETSDLRKAAALLATL